MKATQDLNEIRTKLQATMMAFELDQAMGLIEEIHQLKKEKNACILGHNYMTPDVFHGVSDYIGDSLGLSKQAAETNADIILFNGVNFMAETAKVLNPNKLVLIADLEAGCSLAESITPEDVRSLKKQHPGTPVVTYVNCSAAVKAESDVCCTSANALQVVQKLPEKKVIFLPDAYLAANVQNETDKEIIIWEKGKCEVHEMFTAEDIENNRKQFDELMVIAHPECSPDVIRVADFSGSTSQMEKFIRESGKKNIMLVTECSMGDNLRSTFPDKHFVTTCHACPHMKRITLPKVRDALKKEQFAIEVPEEIRIRAKIAVDRMIQA